MKIWLVTIGEPIPHSNNNLRLHRTGLLAKYISENSNHNLIWWTSDFNHFTKKHIFGQTTFFNKSNNYKIIAIHGCGYKKNISFNRIIDHNQIANMFLKYSLNEDKPDVIVVSFPTLALCNVALDYAKTNNVPILIDYRDMWPEVFLEITPKFFKPVVNIFLKPLFKKTNKMLSNATGVITITSNFLNLVLNKIKRNVNSNDIVIPLAYLKNQFLEKDLEDSKIFWEKYLKSKNSLKIAFIGTLGYQFDLETVIEAVKILEFEKVTNFEIFLCGSGDKQKYLISQSSNYQNIIYPGYISAAQISSLLEIVDIGFCPYNINEAFLNSIPGKAVEYMSSGLPILTTLKEGELGNFLTKNEIGFFYDFKDPQSLANSIKNLINNKSNLKSNRNKIIKIFENNFEANENYKKYLTHIEKVVSTYER